MKIPLENLNEDNIVKVKRFNWSQDVSFSFSVEKQVSF